MFNGSYVALITPFQHDSIDERALRHLVDWQIAQGTHGLVPMGTTGEAPTVSEEEHQRVIQIVVEESAGRVPVIAGAGSNNPLEALRYAQAAEACGANGILCVAGYYNRPSQEGLYQHFKLIHDESNLPMIVYNIPPRSVVDIQPKTMAQLAELPRIIGVKDASMDLSRISLERQLINQPFQYLSGDDITAVGYNAMGGNGCISVTANIAPQLCSELQNACAAKDYETALALHEKLMPLHQALFSEPNPSGIKYAVSLTGLCDEHVRLPMLPLSQQSKDDIKVALEKLQLIEQ